jgi:hypothetical protein
MDDLRLHGGGRLGPFLRFLKNEPQQSPRWRVRCLAIQSALEWRAPCHRAACLRTRHHSTCLGPGGCADTSPAIALGAPAEETREAPATSLATYIVPAADIVAFDFLLNRYGWHFVDRVTRFKRGIGEAEPEGSPVLDNDPFATNQFLHPYQGAMYFGFARSAGLGFWPSFGYAFGGSLLWEIAGETTRLQRMTRSPAASAAPFWRTAVSDRQPDPRTVGWRTGILE